MDNKITFTIDGVSCESEKGQTILEAAKKNNVYIPSLCYYPELKPRGGCRICNVKVNGKYMTACTTPVSNGMTIENNIPEINQLRAEIVEMIFVEGNHYCPYCEKSGNCELQALGYRLKVMAPRFPYQFPVRNVETSPKILKDQNRCILCKRCVRGIKDENGLSLFAFKRRGHRSMVVLDTRLSEKMTDELAQKSMDICPVGSILKKEVGFAVPIGERKYDKHPIGYDIESAKSAIK